MKQQDAISGQRSMIDRLVRALENEGAHVDIFETHISWVIVTDRLAYKFKKAVHFDFLDFSTLDARHFYCQEEVRLNRRLAPDLYLGVASITGSEQEPLIDGAGAAIDYAVKMRTFPQQALWSARIKAGSLSVGEIDELAEKIGRFHRDADVAPSDSAWGSRVTILHTAADNLAVIASLVNTEQQQQLREIETWQSTQHQQLNNAFEDRKANGMIREGHGDLHGGNILTIDGHVEAFDCIEFNEALRWIDVIDDIAFTCMDLRMQGRPDLAARLLNRYLELTGDYDGLGVFSYYQTQRALVRCKVALMRAKQLRTEGQDGSPFEQQADRYLEFSVQSIKAHRPSLMIMHGLSGSGKSTIAQSIVELTGAIRIRSDVERKRMHGLAPTSRAGAAADAPLYSPQATQMTYDRLLQLARCIVEAGMPVVVDAAFLKHAERTQFANLAHALNAPFLIIDVQASVATMKQRITRRTEMNHDPSDADVEVLERQLNWNEPFAADEMLNVVAIDSERNMEVDDIRRLILPVVGAC
jgi:aminoglycoside phosphotransferase family enzyme/predicted kinase